MKSTTFVVSMLLVGMLLFGCASTSPKNYTKNGINYEELNTGQIQCYSGVLYSLSSSANISAVSVHGGSARCLDETGYSPLGESELRGYYYPNATSQPKQFYYLVISCGGSSGGSGAYLEECLIIDNKTIISKIESGTHPKYSFSPSRCAWQNTLERVTPPENATVIG